MRVRPMSRPSSLDRLAPVCLLVVGLLVAATGGAQLEPEIRQHGIFSDTLEVHVVNVAVVVTDKKGNPVTGLGRDDFEIFEDGEPMQLTNFFAVEGDQAIPEPRQDDAGHEMPDGGTAAPAGSRPDTRLFLALVVDLTNGLPANRNLILEDLEAQLPPVLGPEDRVLIATYDGHLRVAQPFTRDPAAIRTSLERIQKTAGHGSFLGLERSLILGRMTDATDPIAARSAAVAGFGGTDDDILTDAREFLSEITMHAAFLQKQVRRTTEALGRFTDTLAGLPGRKAVLYVGDGIPLRPAQELFYAWEGKYPQVADADLGSIEMEIEQYRTEHEFLELVARANANQVPLYTLFGGGNQRGLGAQARDRDLQTDRHGMNLAAVLGPAMEDSLRRLASDTGGQVEINPRQLDRLLSSVVSDTSTYYSLGYAPPAPADGKYHRLRVKVKGKGLRVRYPGGYLAQTEDERMAARTLACLLLDRGDNPLGVQLQLGDEKRDEKGRLLVPVRVRVPVGNLVMLPEGERHEGRLSFFVVTQDDDGNTSGVQKIPLTLRIPNDQVLAAVGKEAARDFLLQMRPGEQKLAVGVRDDVAATISTVNLNVTVGSPPS